MRKVALLALSLLGLWDSLYLWWAYTSPARPMVCLGDGCDAVRASSYAHLWGLPLPVYGVAMYATLALLIFAEPLLEARRARATRLAVAGIAGGGFLFSLYLTAISAFTLHAWCTWCTLSAVAVTLVFALALLDLLRPSPFADAAGALSIMRKYFATAVVALLVGTPGFILLARHETLPPPTPASVAALTERLVRPDSHITGNPQAAVTVVEWGDFECAACGTAETSAREIRQKYENRIRFVFRQFPLERIHPEAMKAAEASECAAEQGKFWEAVEKLYAGQEDLSAPALARYARELGLDIERFNRCLSGGSVAQRIRRDIEDGRALGVRATPTFFVGRRMIEGPIELAEFARLLDQELGTPSPSFNASLAHGAAPARPSEPQQSGTPSTGSSSTTNSSFGSPSLLGGGGLFTPLQNSTTTCSEEEALKQQPTLLRTAEVREIFNRGSQAVFVDVRKPEDYRTGRIPGAISIPVEEIDRRSHRLPKDRNIVLYESGRAPGDVCASSRAAGRALLARGFPFEQVKVYQDGLAGWEKAGMPIEH